MQPRDRLTIKEIQVASLVWQGLTNKDIASVLGDQRAGGKELSADRLRQARGLDAARTGAVRRQPRRRELAYATGQWAAVPGGRVERRHRRRRHGSCGCGNKGVCGVWRDPLERRCQVSGLRSQEKLAAGVVLLFQQKRPRRRLAGLARNCASGDSRASSSS